MNIYNCNANAPLMTARGRGLNIYIHAFTCLVILDQDKHYNAAPSYIKQTWDKLNHYCYLCQTTYIAMYIHVVFADFITRAP